VINPRSNVMRASVIGTVASAGLYVLVTAVVMGLVSHHTLVNTGSPFVNAFQTMFPHSAWPVSSSPVSRSCPVWEP